MSNTLLVESPSINFSLCMAVMCFSQHRSAQIASNALLAEAFVMPAPSIWKCLLSSAFSIVAKASISLLTILSRNEGLFHLDGRLAMEMAGKKITMRIKQGCLIITDNLY